MSEIVEPVGHEAIRGMLRGLAASLSRGEATSLHHAWLFAGPAGIGKFAVARWWASLLKCSELGGCGGSCENCRLIAAAVHPDVLEARPAPKDKNAVQTADDKQERKGSFGVAQSREIISRLALRPSQPGPRVAIVREAHVMTPEAQNALLKLLEEPTGDAVIVLVTDNLGAMLPTVRSRCRHLAFGALAEDEVRDALVRLGHEPDDAEAAAACGRGSVARALGFDADGLAARESLLLAWEGLRENPAGTEALVQTMIARKDSGYSLGDLLEWQLAKVETSLGHEAREPSEPLARILDGFRDADVRDLVRDAARIERAIGLVARNANPRIVIRDLLMNVRA